MERYRDMYIERYIYIEREREREREPFLFETFNIIIGYIFFAKNFIEIHGTNYLQKPSILINEPFSNLSDRICVILDKCGDQSMVHI